MGRCDTVFLTPTRSKFSKSRFPRKVFPLLNFFRQQGTKFRHHVHSQPKFQSSGTASSSVQSSHCLPVYVARNGFEWWRVSTFNHRRSNIEALNGSFLDYSKVPRWLGRWTARQAGRELYFFLSPYLFRSIIFSPHRERLNIPEMVSQNDAFS